MRRKLALIHTVSWYGKSVVEPFGREFAEAHPEVEMVHNIDEPMAVEAVAAGQRIGILATVPTSAPATEYLLRAEAEKTGRPIEITTVINEKAFQHLLAGEISAHDAIVAEEIARLADSVDAIALGQISLSQVRCNARVPVFQVGRSGFAHAAALLDIA
jgi:hypothetical protein